LRPFATDAGFIRYAQFAVVSARVALEDARIDYSRENPQARVSVSFGTALGGVCNIAKFRKCVPDR
jgi:3-oxoacyl-(acyl-carrier-protein) synthase